MLGTIDTRINGPTQSLARQDAFLAAAGRPHGHIMLERKVGTLAGTHDSTVRLVAGPERPPGRTAAPVVAAGTRSTPAAAASPRTPPEAFVDAIAEAVGVAHRPENREISWLLAPASGHPLFVTLALAHHDPSTVKPGLPGILPIGWRDLLKGRIVLIGASMIDRDQHTTPLSVREGPVSGVMIHAQALAQRLDGDRDIRRWPWWITYLVVTGVALVCFTAARLRGLDPRSVVYGLIGLVLIGLASVIAYWLWRVDFPSIALTVAWLAGGSLGVMSRWLFPRLGV